ncbi:hypothetical protein KKG52_01845 [Patescibacteria group bacterium]|nr:hypothetical protein [Patescibacteria group bacterium]
MDFNNLPQIPTGAFFAIYLWSVVWKGLSLWKSANLKQRNWFIVLLIVNTAGILEILFLFVFAKKKMTIDELKFWKKK